MNQYDKRHQTVARPLVIMNTMKLHVTFAREANGSCGINETNCQFNIQGLESKKLHCYILSCRMSCNTALKRWVTSPSSTVSRKSQNLRFPGLECAISAHGNWTWTIKLPKLDEQITFPLSDFRSQVFRRLYPPKSSKVQSQSSLLVLRTPPVFFWWFQDKII